VALGERLGRAEPVPELGVLGLERPDQEMKATEITEVTEER
jgi:hypothetical protein